jgi:hypothetical protein
VPGLRQGGLAPPQLSGLRNSRVGFDHSLRLSTENGTDYGYDESVARCRATWREAGLELTERQRFDLWPDRRVNDAAGAAPNDRRTTTLPELLYQGYGWSMGIAANLIPTLLDAVRFHNLSGSLLMLGRQDVVIGLDGLSRVLDAESFPPQLGRRRWHEQSDCVTPESFFGAIGFSTVESLDVPARRASRSSSTSMPRKRRAP